MSDIKTPLSEQIRSLRGKELCEFIIKLCDVIKADAGTNFRGGIFPENINGELDGELRIGPAADYNWTEEELRFIAPELYWNSKRSPASDIYSVGLMMYYALKDGKLPFEDECEDPILRRMNGDDIPAPDTAGRRMGEIIEKAMKFKASERYQSMDELRAVVASCNTSLFLNGEPTAEAVLKKSDDELSDVERMMVNIIEKADEPAAPKTAEPVEEVKAPEARFVEETVTKKPRPTPRPSEMPAPPSNRARVGITGDKITVDPAVNYTSENLERERKLAKELKRRRRRPVIAILVMCVLLIGAAVVFNYITNHAPVPMEAEIDFTAEPVKLVTPVPEEIINEGGIAMGEDDEAQVEETPAEPVEHSYKLFVEDVTWMQARDKCEALGGHLVVINDADEFNAMVDLAVENDVNKIWIGCYRDAGGNLVWVNNEVVNWYQWGKGEPSAYDYNDDVAEDYVMLWYLGGWVYNDQRNDLVGDYPAMYSGQLAYICEMGD